MCQERGACGSWNTSVVSCGDRSVVHGSVSSDPARPVVQAGMTAPEVVASALCDDFVAEDRACTRGSDMYGVSCQSTICMAAMTAKQAPAVAAIAAAERPIRSSGRVRARSSGIWQLPAGGWCESCDGCR
eukprot:SAG22_NODE_4428_length_1272_cov_1.474851_2_plen_130_part_00